MSPREMIADSAVAAVISDPTLADTPIVDCNDAFLALTGYARDEVIGRNCRFLRGAATEDERTEELRAAVRERRTTLVEITNYRRDGTPFRNAVMIAPIYDDHGALRYFLGTQIEVSRPRQVERLALLSTRQRSVLTLVAAGRLNKQIAYELGISERTVKMHRSAMLDVLGCRSVAEAIRVAVEAGL